MMRACGTRGFIKLFLTKFAQTATNWLVTNEPNGIQSDNAAIDVWIRKWCQQNPTKSLFQAAAEFVRDQRKDYLEAWSARQAR
jgi:hypothetical protein